MLAEIPLGRERDPRDKAAQLLLRSGLGCDGEQTSLASDNSEDSEFRGPEQLFASVYDSAGG